MRVNSAGRRQKTAQSPRQRVSIRADASELRGGAGEAVVLFAKASQVSIRADASELLEASHHWSFLNLHVSCFNSR